MLILLIIFISINILMLVIIVKTKDENLKPGLTIGRVHMTPPICYP
jgi:hypothetical protein